MSITKCLYCEFTNSYDHDKEFRRMFQIFEDIHYCYKCCERLGINYDFEGKEISNDPY
jgi:hypothetical protein